MFENILGNQKNKEILEKSIKINKTSHSYIFWGTEGIGKKMIAKEFAKKILCLQKENQNCTCKSCIEFDSDNNPDFQLLEPNDGKIKIEQIREMQRKIAEKPIISNSKVYIINNSDTMTTEAQNCLLKTLEEPPEFAVIILVLSNENKCLSTIKSRCTKIAFQKLRNSDLTQYANENNLEVNSSLLSASDGSISKLLNLQNNLEAYKQLDNIINAFSKDNIVDIWNNADILYKSKDNINTLLEYLNTVFLERLKSTKESKYIQSIKIIENTKNKLSSNANYDMCIDNLLLQIWEDFNESYNRG